MQTNRRMALQGIACGTAGMALGASPTPAYFNFFGSPVRLDRYTRNMRDLTASRVVAEPSLNGGHSLEMEFRFSEKDRYGMLLWDLVPVHVSRIRFHIFNPNPPRTKISLKTNLDDTEGRYWSLETEAQPLRPDRWTKVEMDLSKAPLVKKGNETLDARSIDGAVFSRIFFRFEVQPEFSAFGTPHLLYLDGLELF